MKWIDVASEVHLQFFIYVYFIKSIVLKFLKNTFQIQKLSHTRILWKKKKNNFEKTLFKLFTLILISKLIHTFSALKNISLRKTFALTQSSKVQTYRPATRVVNSLRWKFRRWLPRALYKLVSRKAQERVERNAAGERLIHHKLGDKE